MTDGRRLLLLLGAVGILMALAMPAFAADPAEDSVGVVDTGNGKWYLYDSGNGQTTSFYYGVPGDTPFMGDWDCDGTDTPGLYRRSDGYVYLRNTNNAGFANTKYFFGIPGDVPLAGDFNNDGCDTVSIYRPSEQRIYVINEIGSADQGLGNAEFSYGFGSPGDKPFVGDFDNDGIDTVGLHRESNGRVYFRNSLSTGFADSDFFYGVPKDKIIVGDWAQKGVSGADTVGIFRPGNGTMYLRFENSSGNANETIQFGNTKTVPVSGTFGVLPGGSSAPPLPIHLVSRFTTYHSCCEPRVHNIQTMAREVDGLVVQPGEVFDLNARIGPRTTAKGYVPAPILLDGEGYCCDHPLNIGGGTSQFGTSIYGAIFFGGFEDIDHKPHSRYIARYPMGIEATMGYPSPNVVFRNDTDFPITIRTRYTSSSITVEMWGNNNGRTMVGHHSGGTSTWITSSGDVTARRVTWSITGWATHDGGGTVTVRRWLTTAGQTTSRVWTHKYLGGIS
ncbi:MAG: VanW family protein [Acidimicrobiia bacterium]